MSNDNKEIMQKLDEMSKPKGSSIIPTYNIFLRKVIDLVRITMAVYNYSRI